MKDEIKKLKNRTEEDESVLSVVDSFWGCTENYIKGNLAGCILKYAGCEAWKIAMSYTY